jgi:hypothetical protein
MVEAERITISENGKHISDSKESLQSDMPSYISREALSSGMGM